MKRQLALALAFFLLAPMAYGAEIRVISANPLQEGMTHLVDEFKRATGHEVKLEVLGTGPLNKLLASDEPADVLIGTSAMVDQAIKDGKAGSPKTLVGRVGIGITVRRGAAVPNVSTPAALRDAVLKADHVVYNTAGSGQYVDGMLQKLGVGEQVKAKSTRPANAAQTMERMIGGKGDEIGFGLMSEMKPYEQKGAQFVGPLPAELQNYTNYDGVVLGRSKSADAAREFIRFVTTPAARKVFAESGVD
jgi:molybdate transport system substrate-binding protein